MDRLAEDGTKQHFFCKRSRQIMGKGQSDAIRTAANDNHIILMGSFFAKRAVPKRFFCKRSGSSRRAGLCMGTVANNNLFCKRTRSYEIAGLLQRGRLPIDFFAKDPDLPEGPVFCKEDGCSWQSVFARDPDHTKGQVVCKEGYSQQLSVFAKEPGHTKGQVFCKEDGCQPIFFRNRSRSTGRAGLSQEGQLVSTIFFCKRSRS